MLKVLITGISGFIGSNIAKFLIQNGIEVIGLKRENSNISRCISYSEKVKWVNLDLEDKWKQELVNLSPTSIIHCAWIGVEAKDRDNWSLQVKNINFLTDLIEISNQINLKQFVFLGSQAEYGFIDRKVDELHPTNPTSAYGSVKLASLEILKTFCFLNNVNWVWLRVFSLFGENENENWLIPSLIKSIHKTTEMDFTLGEQQYAYLYINDFAHIVTKIVQQKIDSGIYNISSNKIQDLRTLMNTIKQKINPEFKLNFGAIPYRDNQSMHIQGDISKLESQIGPITFTDFNVALQNTINYYLKN